MPVQTGVVSVFQSEANVRADKPHQEMTAEEALEFANACIQADNDKQDAIRREHYAIRRVWPRLW